MNAQEYYESEDSLRERQSQTLHHIIITAFEAGQQNSTDSAETGNAALCLALETAREALLGLRKTGCFCIPLNLEVSTWHTPECDAARAALAAIADATKGE